MKTHPNSTLLLFLSFLAFIPFAAAHGFVYRVTINGQLYMGNIPNGSPNASIVRQIDDVSPVKGANNSFLNCGQSAQLASQVASANPGDVLTFDWRGGDLSHWPHNTGPLMNYLASCGDTTCDKFDSQNAQWFKISQVGRESNGSDWVQQEIMNGGTANVTLPYNIKPGQYIIRHEIIALHLATSPGGAEFYPSCTQLNIGGSGTAVPSPSELVTFPGGYSDNDPGIYDPSIFDTSAPYTFPGPPIAQLAIASSGSSGSSSPPPSNSTATSTASAASSTSSSGPYKCRLKRPIPTLAAQAVYPRHYSRIMRSLLHPSSWR
jgi:hypothetical protein